MRTLSKTMMLGLVAAVAAAGLGTAGAVVMDRHEDRAKDARHVQAMASARISLAQAIRAGQAAEPGAEVIEAKFKAGKAGPRYEVELLRGQEEVKLHIDPATGAIAGRKTEPLKAQGEDDEDAAAFRGARPTLLEAIAQAEAKGGRVLAAEYEMEDGTPAIELKVADRTGQVSETRLPVRLAAAAGASERQAGPAAPAPAPGARTPSGN